MIDQCINNVFQRDQKVFIPEFGAIIFSEATNKSYFNEHLTFDDGKVISEIERQECLSTEESKKELSQFLGTIKDALKDKGHYYLGGIGYLMKDERGDVTLSKTKEDLAAAEATMTETPEEKPENDLVESITFEDTETPEPQELSLPEEHEEQFIDDLSNNEENIGLTSEADEDRYFNSILSEDDEGVQDYYKRKERYEKKRSGIGTVLWIFIPVLLLGLIALYYFRFYLNDQKIGEAPEVEPTELQASTLNTMSTESAESSEETPEAAPEEESTEETTTATPDTKNEQTATTTIEDVTPQQARTTTVPVRQNTGADQRVYSVILGSFKYEYNADRFTRSLRNEGLDVNKFEGFNNLYFVGFEHIQGKNSALAILTDVRSSREPLAWITRK